MQDLNGDALLNVVVEYANEHSDEITTCPKAIQDVFFIGNFEFEFYNGGLRQFLTNSSGKFWTETIAAFKNIGAPSLAVALEKQDEETLDNLYPNCEEGNVGDLLVAYLEAHKKDLVI